VTFTTLLVSSFRSLIVLSPEPISKTTNVKFLDWNVHEKTYTTSHETLENQQSRHCG
jgi:hypothetical protein